ncbi:MAG: HD domain-containing protein [Bacteroidota bacterium]
MNNPNCATVFERWTLHGSPFGASASADVVAAVLADITAAYAEPARHYHTMAHIESLLLELDRHRDEIRNPDALEFAALFHDVVYDTRRHDNEEQSALYARDALRRLGAPELLVERVAALILFTSNHGAPADDADALLFLDADLAILGTSGDRYRDYSRAIRCEYAWVEEERYRRARRDILEKFLERERIYRTGSMFARYEMAARANIAAELREPDRPDGSEHEFNSGSL